MRILLGVARQLLPSVGGAAARVGLLGVFLMAACHSKTNTQEPVEVEVRQVGFDHLSNSPVVILQDKEKKKAMPIWIGMAEAQAIALQLQGAAPPRPLTHDLLKNILEQAGIEFDRVLVTELKGSTYYARIHLINKGKTLEIDSRPSDAIALALRFHRPIFIEKNLFESALPAEGGGRETAKSAAEPQLATKLFGMTVQDLTEALAAHFALPDAQGVFVTEVEAQSGAARLQRGNVIVALKGEVVHNTADLRHKLEAERGRTVTLQVRRDGAAVQVPFSLAEEKAAAEEEDAE
ncbi:MAG TPA: bifunctional nuclease domain-containing protein [Methylomirabilota bacterium]|jgi:bifunctional DNase/RNase|nr:bifunctional nuclease domain-containing protein [Methylomirabilota bacterium]